MQGQKRSDFPVGKNFFSPDGLASHTNVQRIIHSDVPSGESESVASTLGYAHSRRDFNRVTNFVIKS